MLEGRSIRNVVLLALACLAGAASAQPATWSEGIDWLVPRLVPTLVAGEKTDSVKTKAHALFAAADITGKGVSRASYELTEQLHFAGQRQNKLATWTRFDLNGDGRLTRAEIELARLPDAVRSLRPHGIVVSPTPEQIATVLAKLVDQILVDDLDGDGVITFEEIVESHRRHMEKQPRLAQTAHLVPLSLDRNGDGTVSREEFEAAVNEVIARIDADGNGVVSVEELTAVKEWVRNATLAQQERQRMLAEADLLRGSAIACGFPKPPADARLIVVGAYEGQALSNVGIGGDDTEIMVAQLDIERGTEPLYVVATTHHGVIWQLTGATDRVVKFVPTSLDVASGTIPRVGAIGLPADRVFIPRQANCVKDFSDAKTSEGLRSKGQLLAVVGRTPDDLVGAYALSKVSLPSGIVSTDARYANVLPLASAGPGRAMWKELLRSQPAGIVAIEPEKVVAALPVRRFEVLPREAGLAQLLDEGALEAVGSTRVLDLGGLRIIGKDTDAQSLGETSYSLPRELRIVKEMRFPAGLHGGHSVKFILGKGVPMPKGDPGHSTIISEETGQQLKASR